MAHHAPDHDAEIAGRGRASVIRERCLARTISPTLRAGDDHGRRAIGCPFDGYSNPRGAIADLCRRGIECWGFFDLVFGPAAGTMASSIVVGDMAMAIRLERFAGDTPPRYRRRQPCDWESIPASLLAASMAVDEIEREHGITPADDVPKKTIDGEGPGITVHPGPMPCNPRELAIAWYAELVWYRRWLLDVDKLSRGAGREAVAHPLAGESLRAVHGLSAAIRSLESLANKDGDEWKCLADSLRDAIESAAVFVKHETPPTLAPVVPVDIEATAAAPAHGGSQRRKAAKPEPRRRGRSRSSSGSDVESLLVAELTRHHRFNDDTFSLILDHIGCREIAGKAGVSESTACEFFKRYFGSHTTYRRNYCRDQDKLVAAIKMLRHEMTPRHVFGDRVARE